MLLIAVLGLLVAFWIGYVNLLQLGFIMAITAPISLFVLHRGVKNSKIKL
jgi:multisubunit Na+/H+ antiporter MnhG subunit